MNQRRINILHISNSYGGTKVYQNLYTELDELDIGQQVFVPLNYNNKYRVGNQQIDFTVNGSSIIYSTTLRKHHRYFYRLKIKNILNSLQKLVLNINSIDIIHASTLCLDGAVAYYLYKKFGKPYIVTIRDTDVNSYYKVLAWQRPFFHNILIHASKVIFISPAYRKNLFQNLIPNRIVQIINNKTVVIPNGIDSLFLKNRSNKSKLNSDIKLVYLGAIQKRKNLHSTIESVLLLRNEGYDISLTIIGKGLENRRSEKEYLEKIENYSKKYNWINIINSLSKETIIKMLSDYDIFIMPSYTETFGLVYVEAISQGLPVLYSKGQGFDNFYDYGVVGYPVDAYSITDISEKLKLIIENYGEITSKINNLRLDDFDWKLIASKYKSLYTEILKNFKNE